MTRCLVAAKALGVALACAASGPAALVRLDSDENKIYIVSSWDSKRSSA
jgi:hypothetical protein